MKTILLTIAFSLLFELSPVCAFQSASQESADAARPETKYQKFFEQTGAFVQSRFYLIGQPNRFKFQPRVWEAWTTEPPQRVFAADLSSGLRVDFEALEGILLELDKVIAGLQKLLPLGAAERVSINYRYANGLFLECRYEKGLAPNGVDYGLAMRLYFRGGYFANSLEEAIQVRALVAAVREKLISMGAK